jgi:hypothetical protein
MKRPIFLLLTLCVWHFSNIANSASQQTSHEVTLNDFVKLAEEGSEDAQYLIGYSVLFDQEVSGEKYSNKKRAFEWLDASIKAIPFNGWFVGRKLADQGHTVLAQRYFQKAVNAGYTESFLNLAHLYLGTGYSKTGNLLAKRYFMAAASYGNHYAYVRIGHIYQNGWGVKQDFVKAEQYFQRAISLGESAGYTALGEMKEKHLPNPNYNEILGLYLKDARNGGSAGILGIKRLYKKHNQYVKLSSEEVLFWHYVDKYNSVINYGRPASFLDRKIKIADNFSSDQLLKIKKKAEALVKGFSNKK